MLDYHLTTDRNPQTSKTMSTKKAIQKALDLITEAVNILQEAHSEMENYREDRSERWLESEAGETHEELMGAVEELYNGMENEAPAVEELL